MDHVTIPQRRGLTANIAQVILIEVDVQMLAESTALVPEPLAERGVRPDERLQRLRHGRTRDLGALDPSRELAERPVQPDRHRHGARLAPPRDLSVPG